jgi:hypothetical protein
MYLPYPTSMTSEGSVTGTTPFFLALIDKQKFARINTERIVFKDFFPEQRRNCTWHHLYKK